MVLEREDRVEDEEEGRRQDMENKSVVEIKVKSRHEREGKRRLKRKKSSRRKEGYKKE